MLPVAPATDACASTRGTPAANMVDRVRAKRAMADLVEDGSDDRKLEHDAVQARAHLARALLEIDEGVKGAAGHQRNASMPLMLHERDMLTTIWVKAGRSAPKPLNKALELRNHEHQQDAR